MDPEIPIKPACSEGKLSSEQLTSDEFHRKLYEFFENRGLLCDLKSHLRAKMINALRETPLGKSELKRSISPKIQATSLLLAEYLIQQNCFYTLSVFSTEMPLVNVLPELNNNFLKKPEIGWKFDEKDASDILQTLGFETKSEILENYFIVNNSDALLCCILKASPYLNIKPAVIPHLEKEELNLKDLTEILRSSSLPFLTVEQIMQKFTKTILKEAKAHQIISEQQLETKNKTLMLLEKQLKDKEQLLQKREDEFNEIKKQYELLQAKYVYESNTLKKREEELLEENLRLENLNSEHRRKSEKLKMHARLLSNELSAARTHSRRTRLANNSQPKIISFSGEGEQVPLLPQSHHFIGSHNTDLVYSSDETQHFDVFEETRKRLQRLQQENDRIENRIKFAFDQHKLNVQPSTSDESEASTSSSKKSASKIDLNESDGLKSNKSNE